MFKIISLVLMESILFVSECSAMRPLAFQNVVTENAADRDALFAQLAQITNEEQVLADQYMRLYGDDALRGDDRRHVLTSMRKKDVVTAAAAFVVKTLFFKAKQEVFGMDSLDECIRIGSLLVEDAPKVADGINGVGDILRKAVDMRQRRNQIRDNLAVMNRPRFGRGFGVAAD
ncbi:MAG: hypothetical protein LBB21_05420 [Holosporaceae bacterium]|nr:hypothetical protein [Holosporaceae bacterium]